MGTIRLNAVSSSENIDLVIPNNRIKPVLINAKVTGQLQRFPGPEISLVRLLLMGIFQGRDIQILEKWREIMQTDHLQCNQLQTDRLTLGLQAFEAQEYEQALSVLKPLAEEGASEAQCVIGTLYQLGLVGEADVSLASHWYRKAAEQGHGVAANNLAGMLLQESHYWYTKAREFGFEHSPSLA
jgi:hypothetical protein